MTLWSRRKGREIYIWINLTSTSMRAKNLVVNDVQTGDQL